MQRRHFDGDIHGSTHIHTVDHKIAVARGLRGVCVGGGRGCEQILHAVTNREPIRGHMDCVTSVDKKWVELEIQAC